MSGLIRSRLYFSLRFINSSEGDMPVIDIGTTGAAHLLISTGSIILSVNSFHINFILQCVWFSSEIH